MVVMPSPHYRSARLPLYIIAILTTTSEDKSYYSHFTKEGPETSRANSAQTQANK